MSRDGFGRPVPRPPAHFFFILRLNLVLDMCDKKNIGDENNTTILYVCMYVLYGHYFK